MNQRLAEFLEENPADARQIITKAVSASRARLAARKARELTRRKSALESMSLPGKLADCSIRRPGGLLSSSSSRETRQAGRPRWARDRTYQAILPLRGKIINTEKNRIGKVLSNNEIQAMITESAPASARSSTIAKLRYHRVIVMTDADVDGSHIRTLILTFSTATMPELIERGHVYIAVPPLYMVKLGTQGDLLREGRFSSKSSSFATEPLGDRRITDRAGERVKITEARWSRFVRALSEFEGWRSNRLRRGLRRTAGDFMIMHRLVESESTSAEGLAQSFDRDGRQRLLTRPLLESREESFG